MKRALILFFVLVLAVGAAMFYFYKDDSEPATVKANDQAILTFGQSQIPFQRQPNENKDWIAQWEDTKFTWSGLSARAPYLVTLKQLEQDYLSALIYRHVRLSLKNYVGDGPVVLEILADEPAVGFQNFMKVESFQKASRIEVSFLGADNMVPEVARVNGEPLLDGVFQKDNLQYWSAKRKAFDLALKLITSAITPQVLLTEAKKQGLQVENFVKNNIVTEEFQHSPEALAEMSVRLNVSVENPSPSDQQRVLDYLNEKRHSQKMDEFVAKTLAPTPVALFVDLPISEIEVTSERSLVHGPEEAKVKMIVFSDFNCTPCNAFGRVIFRLMDQYKDQLRVEFRPFFYKTDRYQRLVFEAEACVRNQDEESAWQMYRNFLETNTVRDEAGIYEMVQDTAIMQEEFKECFLSGLYKKEVQYHQDYAKYIGVKGKPTILINGIVIEGPASYEQVNQYVGNELARWK